MFPDDDDDDEEEYAFGEPYFFPGTLLLLLPAFKLDEDCDRGSDDDVDEEALVLNPSPPRLPFVLLIVNFIPSKLGLIE